RRLTGRNRIGWCVTTSCAAASTASAALSGVTVRQVITRSTAADGSPARSPTLSHGVAVSSGASSPRNAITSDTLSILGRDGRKEELPDQAPPGRRRSARFLFAPCELGAPRRPKRSIRGYSLLQPQELKEILFIRTSGDETNRNQDACQRDAQELASEMA